MFLIIKKIIDMFHIWSFCYHVSFADTGDIFLPDSAAAIIFRVSHNGQLATPVVTAAISTVEGIAVDATGRKV